MLLSHSTHEKYKNYQLILLVNLSIITWLVSIIYPDTFDPLFQFILLLVSVSIIGIPHGYFDFLIARKLFSLHKHWLLKFIVIYTLISLLYLMMWVYIPQFSLVIFLLLAIYHFGMEDTEDIPCHNFLAILLIGSVPVASPILFQTEEVFVLFEILINREITQPSIHLIYIVSYLTAVFYLLIKYSLRSIPLYILLFLNFIFLPPILSFVLYFCFHHSIRHYLSSLSDEKIITFNFSIVRATIFFIFLTILFSFFMISFMLHVSSFSFEEAVVKYIFITLACLTLPHLLLNIFYHRNT